MNETPYVFLSYATADRERALQIADALEQAGVHVWIDRRGLSGGELWATEITTRIRSCAALALVCTEASVTSRNVRQEIQLAWDSERPIVPLMLDQVEFPVELAYFLQGRQWIEIPGIASGAWTREVARLISPKRSGNAIAGEAPTRSHRVVNLPTPPTPILGRDSLIDEICSMLARPESQLLTLVGPGGVGKTRLALAVAWKYQEAFPGSVQFVDLAQIRDPELVMPTIAAQLGIRASGTESIIDSMQATLHDESLLLVLDNWEQVLEAAGSLGKLLTGLPNSHVLATSREPLRLRAETVIDVSPLSIDLDVKHSSLAAVADNPAVALFVARAAAVRPGFTFTDENRDAIVEICRRLDGLPLAIELAASRSALLSPAQMLQRLDHRLTLLTGGARDLPQRQQTLRDTIAWSDELLTDHERALLRRLSVFAGGFTMESAVTVAGSPGSLTADVDIFKAMERLVGHSLLRLTPGDTEGRFTMLQTIREYGQEQLEIAGEASDAHERHALHFLELTDFAAAGMESAEQATWIKRLNLEEDNLRAALSRLIAVRPALALRMTASLLNFWMANSSLSEASLWYQRALAAGGNEDPQLVADASVSAARIAYLRNNTVLARQLARNSLELFKQYGDERDMARALNALGVSDHLDGNLAEGERSLSGAMDLAKLSGDSYSVSMIAVNLSLARADLYPDSALTIFEEAVEICRAAGSDLGLSVALGNLINELINTGAFTDARPVLREILELRRTLSHRYIANIDLVYAGLIFNDMGDFPLAARMAGAANAVTRVTGYSRLSDRDMQAHLLIFDRLRTQMGSDEFDRHFRAGEELSIEMAFDEVQRCLDALNYNSPL